jgi:uncharacterized integral membrane protein
MRIITPTTNRPRQTATWAAGDQRDEQQFQGVYGTWSVRQQDVIEVWSYRIALSIVALSAIGASTRLLAGLDDVLTTSAIVALGAALQLIHIYVTPLKRMLQVFWGLGTIGYIYVALQPDADQYASTLDYILATPAATWFVGPLGAAMTGVTFKEGMCYGKKEAFALTFLIPALFLVHLFGVDQRLPAAGWALVVPVSALLSVFAGRKYFQALVDDIGDGSVFAFQRMPEEEQRAVLDSMMTDTTD